MRHELQRLGAGLLLAVSLPAAAHDQWLASRADSHAPIGVMGDHVHKQGEVMLSYRYMRMFMEGNRDGTDTLTDREALNSPAGPFMVVPTEMTMEMHMFGAMYAPSDRLTLMAMVPVISKEMDHVTRMDTEFTTEAEDFGDVVLTALVPVGPLVGPHRMHLNLGLSVPTGSIDERDDTPAGEDSLLPYPMQTGSGTYDLRLGATYLGQAERWSWGTQGLATLRLDENDRDYTYGDVWDLTAWLARAFGQQWSTSLRLAGTAWEDVEGRADELNPRMIPTADPDLRAGERVDALVGVNYYLPGGMLAGSRLALEAGAPVYQRLDGPQLETDWMLTGGLQYAF